MTRQVTHQLLKLASRNDPYPCLHLTGKASCMATTIFKRKEITILQISERKITNICEVALMTIAMYNLKSGSQCDSLRRHVSVIKGVIPSDIYHFPLKFNSHYSISN